MGEKLRRAILRLVELKVLVSHSGRNVLQTSGDAHTTGTLAGVSGALRKGILCTEVMFKMRGIRIPNKEWLNVSSVCEDSQV